MNRTGTIPDGKSLQEVVSGIMQNNSVSVKGKLSKDVSAVADFWSETSSTSARRALSGVLLAAIPEEMRSVKLKDGRIVEITLNGIANILQHMPNAKGSFRNGALEFILHLPEFLSSAEEFYREFKGSDHCNFGGIVDFNGTEFYVSVTCTSAGNSLRVKAVNSIKKSSLDAWTETTTAEKRGSSSESVLRAASKLDMADVLKWLFLNQEKTVGDFDSWMRSNRARLEEAEARKRQSRVRPGVGLDVSRNGMNERKGSADDQFLEESDFGEDGRVKPEVLAEIEAEKAKIREDAQKNGTWMKAPNGAPSKLNAEQWVLVRTKRFKRWFGDWEAAAKRKDGKDAGDIGDNGDNGDEGVSKVVDENGEPLAVYHGTGEKFYEFSHKFGMRNGASLGRGFYFTEDEDYARGYGNEVMGVFLNIRKPLEPGRNKISKEDLKRVVRRIDPNGDTVADYASSDRGYPGKEWYERSLEEAVNAIFSVSNNYVETSDSDILGELFSVWGGESALRGVAEVLGYDGFIPKRTLSDDVKIAFFPEQIKSATENAGTYAGGNADIRWSIRRKEQEAWNAVLDAYEAGTLPQRGMNVVLGRTPVVLQRCGAEDLPIKISKSVLDKVVSEKHGISVSELRKLLTNIDDPIAVFRSRTQENSLVVLTEIIDEKNGDNAIVAIRLDAKENRGANEHEINAVSSIYGRPSGQIEGFMRDGLALYVNQKKSRAYARSKRLQLPPEASKRGNLSLLTEEDFPDDALGEIKVNPESFGERQSRSYRAADTHEQELMRLTDATMTAARMLIAGKENVAFTDAERALPEWELMAIRNRALNIYRAAKARGAKLRAAGNALGSEEFEEETDAGKMKRAAAADIVAEKIV